MTPLEKRLSAIPFPEPPAAWRREILAAAEPAKRRHWFLGLLWPHPYAWGALAACWGLIVALNFSGPRGPELYAVTPKGMKPLEISTEEYFVYLRVREAMLAEAGERQPFAPRLDPRKL